MVAGTVPAREIRAQLPERGVWATRPPPGFRPSRLGGAFAEDQRTAKGEL